MENKGEIIRNNHINHSSDKKSRNNGYGGVSLLFVLFIIGTTAFSQNTDNVVKMRLDSVVVTDENGSLYRKETFLYDKQKYRIQCTEDYFWNDTNNYLMKYFNREYMYDANNNLIMQIEYDEGKENIKEECIYDVNNNPTMRIEYHWDDRKNNWEKDFKREYMYDSNRNLIEEKFHIWDVEKNEWTEHNTQKYYYSPQITK